MRGKTNVSVCRGHELANALYAKVLIIGFTGMVRPLFPDQWTHLSLPLPVETFCSKLRNLNLAV